MTTRGRHIAKAEVVGTWRLVSYEAGAGVYPMGKDAIGVLHYSPEGKVSVHIRADLRWRIECEACAAARSDVGAARPHGLARHQGDLA